MFRTTDGGSSWQRISIPGNSFNAVFFTSSTTGWGVGYSGRIYKTTDGGLNWTQQASSTSQFLNGVFFLNANQGWAIGSGGTIVATTNGGTTWTLQSTGTTAQFQSIQFVSATEGWAVANISNGLYHTTNGGSTWTQVTVDAQSSYNYAYRVQFVSPTTGFLSASSAFYATTNGGQSWKKSYHYGSSGAMYFVDATHGWKIGGPGSILSYQPAPATCSSVPITVAPAAISPLSTLTSGNWSSPAVWSCGSIPTVLDAVRINASHTVALPTGYNSVAKSIELQGQLQYNANATLQVGEQ